MAQSMSKISVCSPIFVSCKEYVHPWSDSCMVALCGLYFCSILYSLRMYSTVYLLSLATKGKIPKQKDVIKTIYGILQSTAFLSFTAFGYTAIVCLLRRIMGNYNVLTVSFFPAFLSSIFAILIERPSRRSMLCLYVSNIATETVWNMLLSRNLVRNINYGNVAIFSISTALLLTYYRGGWHKKDESSKEDTMFSILRFIVGPYEEKDHAIRSSRENIYRHDVQNDPFPRSRTSSWCSSSNSSKNSVYILATQALRVYKRLIQRIKCCDRHFTCPHPFSCLHYTMQGAGKMFSLGLGIQVTLKLLLNFKYVFRSPKAFKSILFKKQNLNLAVFMGGFTGLFRAILCLLRRTTQKDSPMYALPAGLIAGMTFSKYPDNSVALYVMWKLLQITYNIGNDRGFVPKVPGFVELLYSFSTGILFHVAIIEPTNLRANYWKFLHGISGGRIACMSRPPLDVWGLKSSELLAQVLEATKTQAILS